MNYDCHNCIAKKPLDSLMTGSIVAAYLSVTTDATLLGMLSMCLMKYFFPGQ